MRYRIGIMCGIIAVALLNGCGQQAAAVPTAQPTTLPVPTNIPTISTSATVVSASPTTPPTTATTATAPAVRVTDSPVAQSQSEQIGDRALRNLQALPQAGAGPLKVQQVEAQEWSDSGLGCPDPAVRYLTVITPGYKVTLSDGSTTYAVHTNDDGSVMVWCNAGIPVALQSAQ